MEFNTKIRSFFDVANLKYENIRRTLLSFFCESQRRQSWKELLWKSLCDLLLLDNSTFTTVHSWEVEWRFFANHPFKKKSLEGISFQFLDPPVWSFLHRLLSRVLGVLHVVLAHDHSISHPITGRRSHLLWKRATRPYLPGLKCLPFPQSQIRQGSI